jgi:hypothetical protein
MPIKRALGLAIGAALTLTLFGALASVREDRLAVFPRA